MKIQNKKGFTLIELLVVITIIGILATWATTIYTSQIQKARDTTRINDMKSLEWWINQSYNDTNEYPKGSALEWELKKYMQKIPADSKHWQPCNDGGTSWNAPDCWYAYITWPDDNWILFWEYEISTAFENLGNVQNRAAKDGWGTWAWTVRYEIWIDTPNNTTNVGKDSISWTQKWVTIPNWTSAATSANDTSIVIINGNS